MLRVVVAICGRLSLPRHRHYKGKRFRRSLPGGGAPLLKNNNLGDNMSILSFELDLSGSGYITQLLKEVILHIDERGIEISHPDLELGKAGHYVSLESLIDDAETDEDKNTLSAIAYQFEKLAERLRKNAEWHRG